jgi:iron(III) transport system permease protein
MNKFALRWNLSSLITATILTLPLWVLVAHIFIPGNENWSHLLQNVLQEYVTNSILLMTGVAVGTLVLGVTTAWLVSHYKFFGSRWLLWALLLPLAMPAYIIAYTYTGLLEFEGPVQTYLRWLVGPEISQIFPEIRSLGGAILIFSFVLYPYVYLLGRSAFGSHTIHALEVSRTLGAGPFKSFFKIALPMARPALIAGITLAMMETLADFGAVQHFSVDTFTTGIYRTWSGLGDTTTAIQLSLVLLTFVTILITLERWSRKQQQYFSGSSQYKKSDLIELTGKKNLLAFIACFTPILLGFILPSLQLLTWSITTAETQLNGHFLTLSFNSLILASSTALIAVCLAIFLNYAKRLHPNRSMKLSVQFAHLGYAVPGTVLAIVVLVPLTWFDHHLDTFLSEHFQISSGLLLSGSLFALIFAYVVRFMSVSLQSVDSGLARIKPAMDDSARLLGANAWTLIRRIHFPLMRTSVLTAFILVFVEVMKELPTTLILRPFDFDTLSVRAYEMASDERLADAGLPALMIVITSLIPVIILSKLMDKKDV